MNKVIQQSIKDNMHYDVDYTHVGIWIIYDEIMNRDYFIEHVKISPEALKRHVRTWNTVVGSWISRKEINGVVYFYKTEPEHMRIVREVKAWLLLKISSKPK